MNNSSPARKIIDSLVEYRRWWLAPTLICTVLAIAFALFSQKSYTSRQSLIVRDDLVGTFYKPGRFDSLDLMKSAQETILEISRRPQVVRTAMKRLGPPSFTSEENWLGDESLEKMQGEIQISAPNGAEFGRTEAIVLAVKQDNRERAGQFVTYLLDAMEDGLRDLRSTKFGSMQQELEQAAILAEKSYLNSADELKSFERNIGVDLSTLISIYDAQGRADNLQNDLSNLSVEKRKAWADMEKVRKQIQILNNIAERPDSILEVQEELLQLQPTLATLAQGLNKAELTYSKSKGRYQGSHPKVREAYREILDVKERIKAKLARALGSLNYQLELRQDKYNRISGIVSEKQTRLSDLSSLRVDYATLRQDVDKKREINAKAQANLSEIVTLGTSAKKVSLISRIDEPQTELYPDGASNKAIVFGGMIAGLMIGLGLVLFVSPIDDPNNPEPDSSNAGDASSVQNQRRSQSPPRESARSRPTKTIEPEPSSKFNPASKPDREPVAQSSSTVSPGPSVGSISEAIRQQEQQHQVVTEPVEREVAVISDQAPADDQPEFETTDNLTEIAVEGAVEPEPSPPQADIAKQVENSNHVNSAEVPETQSIQEDVGVGIGMVSSSFQTKEPNLGAEFQSDSVAFTQAAIATDEQLDEVVVKETLEIEAGYESKSAAEIAAEITGTLVQNSAGKFTSGSAEIDGIGKRDHVFAGDSNGTEDADNDFSSLVENAQKAAEDFLGKSPDEDGNTFVYGESPLQPAKTEIDIPRVEPAEYQPLPTPVLGQDATNMADSALPLPEVEPGSDSDFNYGEGQLANSSVPNNVADLGNDSIENVSSANVFNTLYDDGAAQILESANFDAGEIDSEDFDLSSLRVGKEDHRILSEKLNQLDQSEPESDNAGQTPISSIDSNAVVNTTGQANEPPFAIQDGEPLKTSIENSTFSNESYESGPQSGQEPENRPTATTVDLRMLKQQLAGSQRKEEDSRPLSELLGQNVHESDAAVKNEKPIDKSIADLADSIREICQNDERSEP